MHCVYKITFLSRKLTNTLPYLYIGSKSNFTYFDGILYGSDGNPYYGSSTWDDYSKIVEENIGSIKVDILKTFDNYEECLEYEKFIQISENAVQSPEYFNKALASESNFSSPDFATYRHIKSGKVVRLRRDDPFVLNGTYVGVTKGIIPENIKTMDRSGKNNGFYGKKHTQETKDKIRESRSWFRWSEEQKLKMSEKRKGVPMPDGHGKKVSKAKKGKTVYKNINTGETVFITKSEYEKSYDKSVWVTSASLKASDSTKNYCERCGGTFTNAMFNRWHGENCSELRLYQPWNNSSSKTKGKYDFIFLKFLDIIEFLDNNPRKEDESSKSYFTNTVQNMTKSLFGFGNKSEYWTHIKRIVKAYSEDRINEDCLNSYHKWKALYETKQN